MDTGSCVSLTELTSRRRRSTVSANGYNVNRRRARANHSASILVAIVIFSMVGAIRTVDSSGRLTAAAATPTGNRHFRESPNTLASSPGVVSAVGEPRTAATTTTTDPCYDDEGNARRCVPDFVNAAYGRDIMASSTCGNPPIVPRCSQQLQPGTKSMRAARDPSSGFGGQCFACDASSPLHRHPASYLTDNNNPNNMTCWTSEPFTDAERNVTLTLRLGKKYEVTYVSMQFCSARPDSMAIYKSVDYGRSWLPFQFYSSDCRRTFNRPVRGTVTRANEQEPLCTDVYSNVDQRGHGARVAFSTLEGRPSALEYDTSPVLQDWITATDIRILFMRPAATVSTSVGETLRDDPSAGASGSGTSSSGSHTSSFSPGFGELGSPLSPMHYYSLSDLSVGGRCKCNGHAARCVPLKNGAATDGTPGATRLVCDCKHHTTGTDCERCQPFHYDRPWARATVYEANECIACTCNGHSRRCRFNKELYLMSSRRSGGICIDCQHRTAGRHCQYCQEGYYRNPARQLTHPQVCKACECHPVGSTGKTCNQTSGQCACKEGVTGITCNRCLPGYQQSRSPITPCVKVAGSSNDVQSKNRPKERVPGGCLQCKRPPQKIVDIESYCKADFVLHIRVAGRELAHDDWIKYRIDVMAVFKHKQSSSMTLPLSMLRGNGNGGASGRSQQPQQQLNIWVPVKDAQCHCPKLRVGKSYALVGGRFSDTPPISSASSLGRPQLTSVEARRTSPSNAWSLVLDARNGAVIRWNEHVAQSIGEAGRMADQQRKCSANEARRSRSFAA